jgi:hypothetical protein
MPKDRKPENTRAFERNDSVNVFAWGEVTHESCWPYGLGDHHKGGYAPKLMQSYGEGIEMVKYT